MKWKRPLAHPRNTGALARQGLKANSIPRGCSSRAALRGHFCALGVRIRMIADLHDFRMSQVAGMTSFNLFVYKKLHRICPRGLCQKCHHFGVRCSPYGAPATTDQRQPWGSTPQGCFISRVRTPHLQVFLSSPAHMSFDPQSPLSSDRIAFRLTSWR